MRKPVFAAALLAIGLLGAFIGRVTAKEAEVRDIGGFRIHGLAGLSRAERSALEEQIAMVSRLAIKPHIATFFRAQPITLSRQVREPGVSGPEGVVLAVPDATFRGPVLLHELLHLYHARQLADGMNNSVVRNAFVRAHEAALWPDDTYMMSNAGEFFAMTASAVLHGRLLRPPGTRANVAARMPDYYRWIISEFGLELKAERASRARA